MESTTQLHLLELLRNVSSVTKHIALQAKMQGRRGSEVVVNKNRRDDITWGVATPRVIGR